MDIDATLEDTAHRPWALPAKPWALQMGWRDLAFFHWRVPAETLEPLVPPSLTLDTFEGETWIGVVPFRMVNVRARYVPPLPLSTNFEELNVRTYVRRGRYPGVWFFSFDAAGPLAVFGARVTQNLPYYNARMSAKREGEWIDYGSRRTHRGAPQAELQARYRPTGRVARAEKGTLEHWLTERYCLFSLNRAGSPFRLDIHHPPWPLQPGETEIERNTMTEALGIRLPDTRPLVHFAESLDVLAWNRVPV